MARALLEISVGRAADGSPSKAEKPVEQIRAQPQEQKDNNRCGRRMQAGHPRQPNRHYILSQTQGPIAQRLGACIDSGARGRLGSVRRERYAAGKQDRKSTRLNSSHGYISYAVFCLKKKKRSQRNSA